MSKNDMMNKKAEPQWAKAKYIFETRGITAPQLHRYAADGLIRSSKICRPGLRRGTRLFNVGDLDALITRGSDSSSKGDAVIDETETL